MRVFKTKTFERWAGKAGVTDGALLNAVAQMERGLIDADLGGNVFKQRVAMPGRGKSGSTRTIVATRFAGMLLFLYGFEKNERDNISGKELEMFKRVAEVLLGLVRFALAKALERGELKELSHEQTDD
ncbi:type II toxin-antitoxin system RelE/ParE family toxin [Accumulibacter sp.]|uniref:type II toxin-antitoxin system RelE/ParE family toxin n=1 Tax=Accumulibacter sp. TaxID=2053492 RepID=UPI001A62AAAC|nr:type II toxin-antitoxin system RelE/ParE family toxin [Accumulibacter sp.]MBL8376074.1 type II toxin-antitoxin system RelE/ParE family toxin [Accumulibacter sp.]